MAIRPDGAVVISAIGSTAGLGHEFMIVNGQTGSIISSPGIPLSTITDLSGTVTYVYSVIGPPIVDPNGAAYVEYEVRNVAYPPKITSAVVYLLEVAMDGTQTTTTQSTILHEALHNLTGKNDPELKTMLDLVQGQSATDDINHKLEANGCAGTN